MKCPICHKYETCFFKVFKIDNKYVKIPNEFWLCDKCYKIELGKKLSNGRDEFFYTKIV